MKNHQARLNGSIAMPETHISEKQRPNCRSKHRHSQKPHAQGQQTKGLSKGGNRALKHFNLVPKALNFRNKGKTLETVYADMCYRYGAKNHWYYVCRDPTKIVLEYHSRREKFELNFA